MRRFLTAGGLALAAAAILAALCPLAAEAAALTPHLRIAGGRAWVRSDRVVIGDGGWTPFTTPGVVTWDGGSIMGSIGIGPGKEFAQQTRSRLGRPCKLYISATPGADIDDMIAEAPQEIDAHFTAPSDADICVVQGGASDLKRGPSAVAEVFAAVKSYCQSRRMAGFQVAVVTLLPRSDIPEFNEARNSFNALVRSQWPTFADAIVDVAADHRLGDDGDNENLRYYRGDQKHPNARGCAVMAAVTAPVLDAITWKADSLSERARNGQGEWSDWQPYTYRRVWTLEPGDGHKTVAREYRDSTGETVSAAGATNVDTVRPRVTTLRRAAIRPGSPVRLAFRVDDRRPCARVATVTISIRRNGRVLRSVVRKNLSTGKRHVLTLDRRLPRGDYVWQIRARDGARNPQVSVGRVLLRVD